MDLSVVWPSQDRCGRVPEPVSHFFKMVKNEKMVLTVTIMSPVLNVGNSQKSKCFIKSLQC